MSMRWIWAWWWVRRWTAKMATNTRKYHGGGDVIQSSISSSSTLFLWRSHEWWPIQCLCIILNGTNILCCGLTSFNMPTVPSSRSRLVCVCSAATGEELTAAFAICIYNICITGDWSLFLCQTPNELGRPVSLGRVGFDCCGEYMVFLVLVLLPSCSRLLNL
jgi:hypothetical protein